MIFSLFSRVAVKIGEEEKHIFDRSRLMFTEVAEIEKVTGLSYGEWERELGRYSIKAVAALLHVLRQRAGMASDFKTMQFNAADLDVVPLNDDDTEMTPDQIAAELNKRRDAAKEAANPTPGVVAAETAAPPTPATSDTKPSSPSGTTSGRGSGKTSPGVTSASSSATQTSG